MSAITTRPRILRLSMDLLRAVNTRACLCSEVIEPLHSGVDAAHRRRLASLLQVSSGGAGAAVSTRSMAQMRGEFARTRQEALGVLGSSGVVATSRAVSIATSVALARAGYVLESGSWEADLRKIEAGSTKASALKAADSLVARVEDGHRRAVERTLVSACARASAVAGFASVSSHRGIDGSMRVIASDPLGRTLVSEVRILHDRAPSLATEVIGITDGTCDRILDLFDAALEAEGVRGEPPPRRSATAGLPTLAAAREFLRRRPRRAGGIYSEPPAFADEADDSESPPMSHCNMTLNRGSRG